MFLDTGKFLTSLNIYKRFLEEVIGCGITNDVQIACIFEITQSVKSKMPNSQKYSKCWALTEPNKFLKIIESI